MTTEPEFISNTIHNFYGFRLRKIVHQIHLKRKYKLIEKWYILPEGEGAGLPHYVQTARGYGYKSYNSLFASVAFYKMAGPKENIIIC